MRISRMTVAGVRRLEPFGFEPGAGLNLITGENGAGKTSVLEAIHLMAYGRSFRGRVRDGLIRTGMEAVEIFVEWRESAASLPRRAGLRHSGQAWTGKLDGESVQQLGDLCAALAVVTFEPGSHALVTGGGEPRRRFMDWGLFHVEQDSLVLWRRYARALKQRNALLKSGTGGSQLDAWDYELAEAGEPLTEKRQQYLINLEQRLALVAAELVPALGRARLEFQPGWRRHELSLADALLLARERDRASGHTTVGPHRADWTVKYDACAAGEALSRGQAKLTALACLLSQAEDYTNRRGESPIIALDDLASELDRQHQRRVLTRLLASNAQVFVTGTEEPAALADLDTSFDRFHVEQGVVSRPDSASRMGKYPSVL